MRVTNEDFVVAYVTSESTQQVAEALGVSKSAVGYRAKRLRKNGVNLPKFQDLRGRAAPDIDVLGLNELVKKHLKLRKQNRSS